MRVLVVRCGALGDLVYSTSVIDALKLEYGEDVQIDFVTTPSSAKLFDCDKRVHNVFLLKHKKVPIIFSSQKKAVIKESQKEPYDLLINFEMGKQFKSFVEKIKAKRKAGWFCENINITKTHMVEICKEFYSNVISKENLDKSYPRLVGAKFDDIKAKFGLPDSYIIFSPSNSHNKKKGINYRAWPHGHWKELLTMIPNEMKVVMIGAKGEEAFFEPIKPYDDNVIDLVGQVSIPQMVSVVENAKALVVTDTGTAHIASAVNTPVFCLIGPTPEEQTGPYKTPYNDVFIIKSGMKCSPCYKTKVMEECLDNICMKNISAETVYYKIIEELDLH